MASKDRHRKRSRRGGKYTQGNGLLNAALTNATAGVSVDLPFAWAPYPSAFTDYGHVVPSFAPGHDAMGSTWVGSAYQASTFQGEPANGSRLFVFDPCVPALSLQHPFPCELPQHLPEASTRFRPVGAQEVPSRAEPTSGESNRSWRPTGYCKKLKKFINVQHETIASLHRRLETDSSLTEYIRKGEPCSPEEKVQFSSSSSTGKPVFHSETLGCSLEVLVDDQQNTPSSTPQRMSCEVSSERSLHVFIFDSGARGFDDWNAPESTEESDARWHMLLDTLLKCQAVESQRCTVKASLLSAGDALHVDAEVQDILGCYTAPSLERWVRALRKGHSKNDSVVRWQRERDGFNKDEMHSFDARLANFTDELSHVEGSAYGLFLHCGAAEESYEELKTRGEGIKTCTVLKVYVFLVDAWGFVGPRAGINASMDRLAAAFKAKLGPSNTTDVNITGNGSKICSASVASFIRIEWENGGLQKVVAGAQRYAPNVESGGA